MQKLELPNHFTTDTDFKSNEVVVKYFESHEYSTKTKITLQANLISFLLEGSKELYHNDLSKTIHANQFVIAKSGNCLMSERLSENQKYASLLFFFDIDLIRKFRLKYPTSVNKKEAPFEKEAPFLVFECDTFVQNFVRSLRLLNIQDTTATDFLKLKLEEILLYLVQKNGSSFLDFFESNIKNKASRLETIVENNICSRLSLEELAFLCHMSLSTFKREFYKNYGISPSKWFQNKRLEKSALLLKMNKERPSDIYHTIGYESLSSFTQSFKQKFGITPKQYQLDNN